MSSCNVYQHTTLDNKSEGPVYKPYIKKIFSFWLLWMIWLEIWNNKNWPTKVKQQQCYLHFTQDNEITMKFKCWQCCVELCINPCFMLVTPNTIFDTEEHISGKISSHCTTDPLLQTLRDTPTAQLHRYAHCKLQKFWTYSLIE